MSSGLGFNKYAARYMSKVTDAGGTAIGLLLQQSFENLANECRKEFYNTNPVAVWPFYGGNAACHSINLFGDDLITWGGTVTHDANGVTGSASGVGHTSINLALSLNPTQWSIGVYVRTNTAVDGVYEIGAAVSGVNTIAVSCRTVAGNLHAAVGGAFTASGAVGNSQGLSVALRNNLLAAYCLRNGAVIASNTTAWGSLPSVTISLCALNGVGAYSSRNIAFAFVGGFLQAHTGLYNTIQAYQTLLARNV